MGSSLTTLHIYNSLVSICDYFLGCLLWYKGTSVLPQKAPEKVVTDGYEGAIYVQCGRDDHIHYINGVLGYISLLGGAHLSSSSAMAPSGHTWDVALPGSRGRA